MSATSGRVFPLCDLALAQRLERVEAEANMRAIETRAKYSPDSGACWIEVAGAYAMYDGPAAPTTQTFGLGLHKKVTSADMEKIEEFYGGRGSPAFHTISPLADPSLLTLLNERGYQPLEFTNVMVRPVWRDVHLAAPHNEKIHVRLVQGDEDVELYVQTAVKGWNELVGFVGQLPHFVRMGMNRPALLAFLAELDGQAIATGTLIIYEGVGLIAETSTIPQARRQGAQLALHESRLRVVAAHGCDLAMLGVTPGGTSQRNAERHGFRIAYTRIKWRSSQPKLTSRLHAVQE